MAKENENAPAIDYDKLGAAIGKALGPTFSSAIGDSLKPVLEGNKAIADAMGKLTETKAAPAAKTGEDEDKPLTTASAAKLFGEMLTKQLGQQQQASQLQADKQSFLATNTKDSKAPQRYFQLGDDRNKWADEIKAGQTAWETEFKAAGGKIDSVAPPNTTGTPPKTELDPAKLTQEQFASNFLPKAPGTPATEGAGAAAGAAGVAGGAGAAK